MCLLTPNWRTSTNLKQAVRRFNPLEPCNRQSRRGRRWMWCPWVWGAEHSSPEHRPSAAVTSISSTHKAQCAFRRWVHAAVVSAHRSQSLRSRCLLCADGLIRASTGCSRSRSTRAGSGRPLQLLASLLPRDKQPQQQHPHHLHKLSSRLCVGCWPPTTPCSMAVQTKRHGKPCSRQHKVRELRIITACLQQQSSSSAFVLAVLHTGAVDHSSARAHHA